ncbi:MAG: hydrolase TatD [Candidatus Riflebacteria bacterium HGW-Riflebacteria-2]|jgi:TatD DNase family protein|nr:MAG: hydrolase TatD [Candidatus Riflebacteria bacterium HGW-Riflebacteria-2]
MGSLFLVDVHAHLQDEKLLPECDEIVKRAEEAGVKRIINAGTCIETSKQAIEIARKHSSCLALAGVHPHDASGANSATVDELRKLAALPEVVGIGEIGLDFHYNFSPPEVQVAVFKSLWQLAVELNLPAVIHVREAYEEFFAAISELPVPPKVMLHCFSGDLDIARRAADLGFHFSIGGALTFPKSETTRAVFKFLSADVIHLETDCPYLAPQPKRGKRNEPAWLPLTLEHLAKVRGTTCDDLARILHLNAISFFGPRLA